MGTPSQAQNFLALFSKRPAERAMIPHEMRPPPLPSIWKVRLMLRVARIPILISDFSTEDIGYCDYLGTIHKV